MAPEFKLPLHLPINDNGSKDKNARITISQVDHPSNSVYLISFNSAPDNRLTPNFLDRFVEALQLLADNVDHSSVVMTTSELPKFYSNGFNLELAIATPGFWRERWNRLLLTLLTYPMPTVAIMNGHAFAAAFMTAMHHDYRVMNKSKGWAALNELEFGAELAPAMTSIFREKVSPRVLRSMILEAHRFTGPEALELGIVDKIGDLDSQGSLVKTALELVDGKKLVGRGKTKVYGRLRDEMYRETIQLLEKYDQGAGSQRTANVAMGRMPWSKL